MLDVTVKEDNLVQEKHSKTKMILFEHHSISDAEMEQISSNDLRVENELTKALLLLNPESITPKQALEIIYDLKARAEIKSYQWTKWDLCWENLAKQFVFEVYG